MSFLNRSVLQERAAAATVEKHPLQKECDVPPNVKQAYLQGCVLAVLERDDGKVTDAARQEIVHLGLSLELAESEIDEAIGVVSGLTSTEDQSEFLKELTVTLSTGVYPRFFMADFEQLIKKDGVLSADAAQTVDYFGRSLTQEKSWRNVLRARKATDNDGASKGVSTLGRQRKDDDGEGKKRTVQPSGVDSYARLLEVVASHLNRLPEKIRPSTVLIDDLDGVETAQLMQAIEREFGCRIPQSDFARLRTVECACQYLGCSCPSSDREGNGKGTNATSQQRKLMRERGMVQGKDGVYERLLRVVALQLNFSPVKIKPGTVLIENLDGIETVQLMQAIEYEFGICIPQSDFSKLRTMECACRYLGGGCPTADQKGNCNGPNVESQQIESMRERGIAYLTGAGVAQDLAKGFSLMLKTAQTGDAESQNMVGMCHLKGWGTGISEKAALKWFLKAANQGYDCAQFNIGTLYESGQGCQINPVESANWYLKAAQQGHLDAQNHMGMCYFRGFGVPQDYNLAFEWCRRAADRNHPAAAWNIAMCFRNGWGVRQNGNMSRVWLEKAAKLGYQDAKHELKEIRRSEQAAGRSASRSNGGGLGGFIHENESSIKAGLQVAGRELLRGLFGF